MSANRQESAKRPGYAVITEEKFKAAVAECGINLPDYYRAWLLFMVQNYWEENGIDLCQYDGSLYLFLARRLGRPHGFRLPFEVESCSIEKQFGQYESEIKIVINYRSIIERARAERAIEAANLAFGLALAEHYDFVEPLKLTATKFFERWPAVVSGRVGLEVGVRLRNYSWATAAVAFNEVAAIKQCLTEAYAYRLSNKMIAL